MKKFLCLFCASLMALTSCTKDDDSSSNPASSILVKKLSYPQSDGSTYSEAIVYNGNKIVSKTEDDGEVIKYTYVGDFITKSEEFDKNGTLDYTVEYAYTNGKLSSFIEKGTNDPYYYKTKYVYNADGTVSYEPFTINVSTGVEQGFGYIGKYTFKDGNLIKDESSESSVVYEYDTKNTPYKNVLGFNLLFDTDGESSVNNVIKRTRTSGSGANATTYVTTFTYKYDANNYPTESVLTFPNGNSTSSVTTQFAY